MGERLNNFLVTTMDGGANQSSVENAFDQQEKEGEMEWDEVTQGLVLASFFYGYALTQIVGGRLADLYGTRWVFGSCIFSGGICAVLSPLAARTHYAAFIALRIIQGIFQGASWPSMHPCLSHWIPPIERPRFIAVVYLGATLSTSMTLPLCGVIIAALGWAAAFYVTGALSLAWCALWFFFMYDTPRQHPRISERELRYIEGAVTRAGTSRRRAKRLPVASIARSLPVWAIVVCSVGNSWGLNLFLTQLPTYMKNILGFSIRENGLLSALPFLVRYVGAITWSSLGDWLIKRGHLSVRNSRRIFSAVAMWLPALMIVGVVFAGCDWKMTVALFCVSMFCNGSVTASLVVNHTDIAPNFSGTIFGVANTASSIVAFTVPAVVGALINKQQTLGQWQKVFWMCVPMYAVAEIFFLVFSSASVQPWNHVEDDFKAGSENSHSQSTELETLKGEEGSRT
ncbi:sialin-like isoform X2 [Penaeus japonicus]|uniref:sialin-like isoform X2 n=1 Tax=Penaeus japonicus TaxID=27405 RepID=UPI001C713C1E|nr:sialin-like isoform X2 [Penaeus japonicus]